MRSRTLGACAAGARLAQAHKARAAAAVLPATFMMDPLGAVFFSATIKYAGGCRESGREGQHVGGHGIHRGLREPQREVLPGAPERQQVVIVPGSRLAALAGNVDRERIVPIGKIEDLAITGA